MFGPLGLGFSALTAKAKLIGIGVSLLFIAVLMGSSYMVGLTKGKGISRGVIAEYETKLATAQADKNKLQGELNEKVTTIYVDKVRTIEHVVDSNSGVIDANVSSRDKNLSFGWIYAHNQAAAGLPIDPQTAANDYDSGIKDKDALQVIAKNYGTDKQKDATIQGWQQWYDNTKKMYDDYSKKTEKKKK